MCDFADAARDCTQASAWASIANNMVALRAQYGRDTLNATTGLAVPPSPMDAIVDTYDQATPTSACAWVRVPVVRLALVARSVQQAGIDKDTGATEVVTAAAPTWEGSTASPIVLTGLADWQTYRYKVFQTMVPLRNVSWVGVVTGC
jgi:type IV pilus assembly protein PilW